MGQSSWSESGGGSDGEGLGETGQEQCVKNEAGKPNEHEM